MSYNFFRFKNSSILLFRLYIELYGPLFPECESTNYLTLNSVYFNLLQKPFSFWSWITLPSIWRTYNIYHLVNFRFPLIFFNKCKSNLALKQVCLYKASWEHTITLLLLGQFYHEHKLFRSYWIFSNKNVTKQIRGKVTK